MLGIQVKSIATPRRRGLRTFGVVVMMLPMLGRGCLRSAACSCPGGRVLRPSGHTKGLISTGTSHETLCLPSRPALFLQRAS